MIHALKDYRVVWLALGLVGGLFLGGFWPNTPTIHAVATSQQDNFAISTGQVGPDMEGLFFLDFLTGDLKGAVLNPNNGKFGAFYQQNILGDLGVDLSKNPQYLMVTGSANFRRTPGNVQLGNTVVYVAEVTSGKVVAYGIPVGNAQRAVSGPFVPLDVGVFRNVAIRD